MYCIQPSQAKKRDLTYTLCRFAENLISFFRLPILYCRQSIVECTITNSIVTTLALLADGRMSLADYTYLVA